MNPPRPWYITTVQHWTSSQYHAHDDENLEKDHEGNAISSRLYEAASGAIIVDPRFLDFSTDLVLDKWSKLVEADFQSESIAAESSLQSDDAKLDLLVKMVKSLTDVVNGLKAQNGENMLQMADQKARLSRQQREIE
jgi:hypothetical protein